MGIAQHGQPPPRPRRPRGIWRSWRQYYGLSRLETISYLIFSYRGLLIVLASILVFGVYLTIINW